MEGGGKKGIMKREVKEERGGREGMLVNIGREGNLWKVEKEGEGREVLV